MNNETLDKMRQLRLYGMYDAFKTNLETSLKESLTPDQFIAFLIASEWDDRRNRNIERAIKAAGFRYKASLEEVDYAIDRGLDKNQFHRLAGLDFIKEHKDIFITGSTGTGKSYLATALGYQACQNSFKVMYVNTAKFMGQLKLAKAKGTLLAELKRIERVDLLILDDFGLQPFDPQSRLILLDIIEDRHQKRSTMLTSQIPVKQWYDIIGEKTIADAVLDRIVHHYLRLELYGESLRRRKSKSDNVFL
ncbi:IS21-like element helper ATPase IstB [Flavobacterium psychrotrophum]|uniref:IS21-like element helper ATPase IstB n=1 Tax=Flavobacterium psychrotrophum TaxID=2294119 RepID=UPI000E31971F|nr:IS21-like element helper ATPase IstB [Flavobacterium psychrotrophum]